LTAKSNVSTNVKELQLNKDRFVITSSGKMEVMEVQEEAAGGSTVPVPVTTMPVIGMSSEWFPLHRFGTKPIPAVPSDSEEQMASVCPMEKSMKLILATSTM
jgi:hypothetical protein